MEPSADADRDGLSPLVFLFGLVVFVASLVLFVVDLALGNDVLRGIVVNAIGAVIMIVWAAQDTLYDPDYDVQSGVSAAGTAVLLYGVYLLNAGVVIAATGVFFHPRPNLGLWYILLAIVTIVVGVVFAPREAVTVDEPSGEDAGEEDTSEAAGDDD